MKFRILIVLFAALLLSECSDSRWLKEFELDEKSFDAEAMQMIKDDSGLTIPAGAKGLNFRYSPPIDPSFVARIEIPKDSRGKIIAQIEAIPDEKIDISGGPGERVTWWPPVVETVIMDRQCTQADGDYFRAILTEENGKTILYVSHAVF
jgi:hypothetical protein